MARQALAEHIDESYFLHGATLDRLLSYSTWQYLLQQSHCGCLIGCELASDPVYGPPQVRHLGERNKAQQDLEEDRFVSGVCQGQLIDQVLTCLELRSVPVLKGVVQALLTFNILDFIFCRLLGRIY